MIETDRLILRPFCAEDAADVFEYLKEPMVNCFACMKLNSLEEAQAAVEKEPVIVPEDDPFGDILQLIHQLAVILHQFKLGAGHQAVVRARDEATEAYQTLHAFDFRVNRRLVLTQSGLVHAADTEHSFTELAACGLKLIAPGADLDGEHDIHTTFKPIRK